ncbi:hypothetical protein, partial [Pseudonocardia pini]|uniref:hypothetical protein n=1 Tax=Pseudonocardia pini TaxID=2758030 RepID=UPI001C68EAC0
RCPPAELEAELRALALLIAAHPPEAVAAAKALLRQGREDAVSAAVRRENAAATVLAEGRGPLGRTGP